MKKENTIIKEDTFENWSKAKNFIPKKNEVIVYTNMGTKIGDGQTKVNDLPFIDNSFYFIQDNMLIIEEQKGDNK